MMFWVCHEKICRQTSQRNFPHQATGGVVVITKNESYTDIAGHTIPRRTVRQLKSEGKLVDSEDGLFPGHSQTLRLK